MIHQKQNSGECYPTVIGMLAGIPKGRLIQEALKAAKFDPTCSWDWALMCGCHDDGARRLHLMSQALTKYVPWMRGTMFRRLEEVDPAKFLKLPITTFGRGAICIAHREDIQRAHIVAFEDHMIYDPVQSQSWPEWRWGMLRHYENWAIDQIFVDPESTMLSSTSVPLHSIGVSEL